MSSRHTINDYMYMTVSVVDQGPGISRADQIRLFKSFVQVRPGSLQQGQGSGLGLSFVKKIVELHGGEVWVESEEGKGSVFTFTIPVPVSKREARNAGDLDSSLVSMMQRAKQTEEVRRGEGCGNQGNGGSGLESGQGSGSGRPSSKKSRVGFSLPRILSPRASVRGRSPAVSRKHSPDNELTVLVVDDAEINRKMLIALLKKMDVTCFDAYDGQIAVDMVKKDLHKYSVVLMDNLMPNMNGVDAARAMRECGYKYIIAGVTGNVMDDDLNEYLQAGADVIYGKPLKLPTLRLLIEHVRKEGPLSAQGKKMIEQGGQLKWVPKTAVSTVP
jgi:CheY-like chemotaxis protein